MAADRLTVLTGPPCGGKPTYAQANKHERSVVVDFDAIARALGYPLEHVEPGWHPAIGAAKAAWSALVKSALAGMAGDVWVIDSAPPPWRLRQYEAAGADVMLVDPGLEVCLERAEERGPTAVAAVRSWFG